MKYFENLREKFVVIATIFKVISLDFFRVWLGKFACGHKNGIFGNVRHSNWVKSQKFLGHRIFNLDKESSVVLLNCPQLSINGTLQKIRKLGRSFRQYNSRSRQSFFKKFDICSLMTISSKKNEIFSKTAGIFRLILDRRSNLVTYFHSSRSKSDQYF